MAEEENEKSGQGEDAKSPAGGEDKKSLHKRLESKVLGVLGRPGKDKEEGAGETSPQEPAGPPPGQEKPPGGSSSGGSGPGTASSAAGPPQAPTSPKQPAEGAGHTGKPGQETASNKAVPAASSDKSSEEKQGQEASSSDRKEGGENAQKKTPEQVKEAPEDSGQKTEDKVSEKPEVKGEAGQDEQEGKEAAQGEAPAGEKEGKDSGKDEPEKEPRAEKKEEKAEEKKPEKAADKGKDVEERDTSGEDEEEKEEGASKKEEKPEEKAEEKPSAGKEEEKKEEKPKESLEQLISDREEIETLLSSIEDSYRDATLPDKTYREVKEKNEKKLAEINKKIEALGPLPEDIRAASEKPAEAPEEPEEAPEVSAKPEPAAPKRALPAAGREKARTAAALGMDKASQRKADALIGLLEQKIEERLRDVIASASMEITDKRLKKMDSKVDALEVNVKGKFDNIELDLKHLKTTAATVGTYDKQFNVMKTEVEKTKALVDSAKEAKNIMDEKLQRTTESFAEIRSIVYQREASSKEQAVLLDKLKDTVSQVDTARILREFTTRDEQLRDVNTRLERLERSTKMLNDGLNKIKGLMTDIGSLENVVKASRHVGEKLERIQEIEERMKAATSKLDGVYVDMKKKLDEFNEYKVKQDKLSGMAEDLVKNVEEVTRRLSDYATKADLTSVKDEVKMARDVAKKAVEAPKQAVSAEVTKLQEEKAEIETLLSTIEENYKSKQMAEADYKKAKESNMQKLVEIEKKIKAASTAGPAEKKAGAREPEVGEKHTRVMLLAKLRESYENGEITKQAYDKSRRLLLGKG